MSVPHGSSSWVTTCQGEWGWVKARALWVIVPNYAGGSVTSWSCHGSTSSGGDSVWHGQLASSCPPRQAPLLAHTAIQESSNAQVPPQLCQETPLPDSQEPQPSEGMPWGSLLGHRTAGGQGASRQRCSDHRLLSPTGGSPSPLSSAPPSWGQVHCPGVGISWAAAGWGPG